MVRLQGKVPGWCGGLTEGRLLWTNRPLRFFARLQAFNGGCEKMTWMHSSFSKMLKLRCKTL